MTTTTIIEAEQAPNEGPLALHLRRLRQWYGEQGIAQNDLADLAGITPRLLRVYESSRRLPESVQALLALAFALQVSVEQLIDPRQLQRLREGVARRRLRLEGGDDQTARSAPCPEHGA